MMCKIIKFHWAFMGLAARGEREAGTCDQGISVSVTCLDSKQISTATLNFFTMYFFVLKKLI